jgi:hypothetical protein
MMQMGADRERSDLRSSANSAAYLVVLRHKKIGLPGTGGLAPFRYKKPFHHQERILSKPAIRL